MLDWLFRHKKQKCEIVIIENEIIIVEGHHFHKHRYHLVLTTIINNQTKLQIMPSLTLVSNQQIVGTLSLIDSVNNNPVTSTFANVTASSDTVAAFTASVDGSGNVVVVGIAAGTGVLSVGADASYTDSTGTAQTKNVTTKIDLTISAVIQADAVTLVVTFGTATNQ